MSATAGALLASSGLFDLDLKKDPIQQVDRMNLDTDLIKARDKTTILIMGVDIRKDDTGRSDTMMVATIDPKLDSASLLSVPRDTRVRIYGYGYDKINAAFAYGGEPLAERTVENFLGIDIDHYIVIDTSSFVKIIDAIGGIDIDVEKRMKYEDPWDDNGGLHINLFPGLQHMDGKTAVTYVRYRDSEGDIGRIKRQQKFMEACMEKVMSPSFIPRIPTVLREVLDAVDTDMTTRQLLELAGALKSAKENGLETDMVPGYPLYIEDISYWIPDVAELQYAMAMGLGVNVDSKLKSRVQRIADEYSESIPDSVRNSYRPNDDENYNSSRSTYDDETYTPSRSTYDDETYTPSRSTYDDETYTPSRSTYDDETYTPSRSTYDDETYNSSRSTYDDETYTPSRSTYDDETYNSSRSTYDDEIYNSSRSTYDDEPYNSSRSTYDDEPYNSSRSTYDDETYNSSRSTYDDETYTPQYESPKNYEVEDFDYTPARDDDNSKYR
jgi:LCP family protein required for cell wall assembly